MKKELLRVTAAQSLWGIAAIIAVIVYCMTLINSTGFFYPDEHFQIIEFARWKMGMATETTIPWELNSQIRPTLQPVITMLLLSAMEVVGIVNPFTQTLLLRIVMAAVCIVAIYCFIQSTKKEFPQTLRRPYTALSYLLWFIPFLCVRYSSETMGASLLLFALSLIISCRKGDSHKKKSDVFSIGVLLCLSFEFRYQMAFAILGIALWSIAVDKISFNDFLAAVGGFVGTLALCALCDSIFYDNWVFAPWNYFRENIVNGVAATFGTAPCHAYFGMVLQGCTPVLGWLIMLAMLTAILLHTKNPVVWGVVCFIIGHMAVSHKELRFLFPIAFFMPLFIMWLAEATITYGKITKRPVRYVGIAAIVLFLVVNTGGLFMEAMKSPRYGRATMLAYLYEKKDTERVICCRQHNVFRVSSALTLDYYCKNDMEVDENIDDYLLGSQTLKQNDIIVLNRGDVWRRERAACMGMKEVFIGTSQWVDILNRFYKIYNPSDVKVALCLSVE